jgi:creatinine amidohydrolase
MAALHPELIVAERATAGFPGPLTPEVRERMFAHGIGAVSANGILGDARGFSAEAGERCIAALADVVAKCVTRTGQPVP